MGFGPRILTMDGWQHFEHQTGKAWLRSPQAMVCSRCGMHYSSQSHEEKSWHKGCLHSPRGRMHVRKGA
jgi:zinc-finger of acetyl-transferase ESCO